MARRKFYVVWEGHAPGIYDNWEECQLQVKDFPGARYKSFDNQDDATAAFRGNPQDYIGLIAKVARVHHERQIQARESEVIRGAIAVDGASSGNPGPIEYRGVQVGSGVEVFHAGPFQGGTNNIAEYLAIVHALALLDKKGDTTTAIYSDSVTALSWIRARKCKTKIEWNRINEPLRQIVERADNWLATHTPRNRILKWDTDNWGEIPADFGRK